MLYITYIKRIKWMFYIYIYITYIKWIKWMLDIYIYNHPPPSFCSHCLGGCALQSCMPITKLCCQVQESRDRISCLWRSLQPTHPVGGYLRHSVTVALGRRFAEVILWPLNVPEPLSTEIVSKPKQLSWGRWEWGVEAGGGGRGRG